ncbi:MAG: hypothetical protein IPM26_06400 [Saprospiraceae bacterium]|nr:hypothetical protein [Saprospiraceae bacterium]
MSLKFNTISIFIVVAIGIPLFSFAQNTKLVLLDKESMHPVSFAFVYLENFSTISDSVGTVYLPLCVDKSFQVTHLNYIDQTISCNQLINNDTLFLKSKSHNLEEITVLAKKEKTDFHKLLNGIFRDYKKSDFQRQISFNYLLRNIINERVVDKITSNITVNYSVGNGCIFSDKWLNYGSFEFTSEAPFLSLDVEQLLLKYLNPFHASRNFSLLTAQKLIRKQHTINLVECESCNSDQIKLRLESQDQTCLITVDLSKKKVINSSYIINSNANLPFFRVADGSSILFEQLVLNFRFDESGIPSVIEGEIALSFDKNSLRTKFLLYENAMNNNQDFYVLGNVKFTNIYQQFLFQPNNLHSYADTSKFFVDTSLLAHLNENYRKILLESPLLGFRLKYLDHSIDSIPLPIYFIDNDFYFDAFRELKNYHNNLIVYQPYNIQKHGYANSIISISPILDLEQSRIYSKFNDPYINQWALNIVTNLYKVDRQLYLSTIDWKDSLNTKLLNRKLRAIYLDNQTNYNNLLDKILIKEMYPIPVLVEINYFIDSIIGINGFEHIIKQDFGCSNCKEGLVSEIIKEGFRMKNKSPQSELSNVYFQYGIIGLSQMLKDVTNDTLINNKLIGSYYSRIAQLYIELKNDLEACKCLKSFKHLWPEGYNLSTKKNFYITNCLE